MAMNRGRLYFRHQQSIFNYIRRRINTTTTPSINTPPPPPPLRVSSLFDADIFPYGRFDRIDHEVYGQHFLVLTHLDDTKLETEEDLFNFYIHFLSNAVGGEYEARKRIYLVSCGFRYGFGAKLDKDEFFKLQSPMCLHSAYPDTSFTIRNTDTFPQSDIRFMPLNPNNCLDNIFSYHYQSPKPLKSNWNHDHWLINIKRPDGDVKEVYNYCTRMLAEVVGSEKEARKKIYIIWCKSPFGFAAEIDEESSKRLKGRRDVYSVIPDYKFDIKDKRRGALQVRSSSHGLRFSRYVPTEDISEDWLVCIDEHVDASHYIYSGMYALVDRYFKSRSNNDKKWLVVIEKLGGEFTSFQQRIECALQTLSSAVGRKEELKSKIYRVQCGYEDVAFGIKMDEETSNTLKGHTGITAVLEDNSSDCWNKDVGGQPSLCLDQNNCNVPLKDMFSYHHLSERKFEWNSNHWLIHLKQHDKFETEQEVIDFCIKMLSEVLECCKIDAIEKIYIVWCNVPFGFSAAIDEETSNKLKGRPEVLTVLPDYASDTQNRERGVLAISPSSWVGQPFQHIQHIRDDEACRSLSSDDESESDKSDDESESDKSEEY